MEKEDCGGLGGGGASSRYTHFASPSLQLSLSTRSLSHSLSVRRGSRIAELVVTGVLAAPDTNHTHKLISFVTLQTLTLSSRVLKHCIHECIDEGKNQKREVGERRKKRQKEEGRRGERSGSREVNHQFLNPKRRVRKKITVRLNPRTHTRLGSFPCSLSLAVT